MAEPARVWAIMAVDPGMTCGISQTIYYTGKRPKSAAQHAVGRHTAFEWKVDERFNEASYYEKLFEGKRQVSSVNPYRKFTHIAMRIALEWERFSQHVCGKNNFAIPDTHRFLVFEDWSWASNAGTTARDAHAAIFIMDRVEGFLAGRAHSYETCGFGPTHNGPFTLIQPGEKNPQGEDEMNRAMRRAGLWTSDFSKSKRGRSLEHANDATKLSIAQAKKCKVSGILSPYEGERREPFMTRYHITDDPGPIQLITDIAGSTPKGLPSSVKAKRNVGQRGLADEQSKEPNIFRRDNLMMVLLRENEQLLHFVFNSAREEITRKDLHQLLLPDDLKLFWRLYTKEDSPWSQVKNGVRIPSSNMLNATQKASTREQRRRFKLEAREDDPSK